MTWFGSQGGLCRVALCFVALRQGSRGTLRSVVFCFGESCCGMAVLVGYVMAESGTVYLGLSGSGSRGSLRLFMLCLSMVRHGWIGSFGKNNS
jgi:hypothetical protein